MKKTLLPVAAVALIAAVALAKAPQKPADPVIMTVNGTDVPLSEFEYLYHKNNDQQVEQTTPEQYLDMFVNYRLKVAEAQARGIDTTKQFNDELNRHRNDLARPYLVDTAMVNAMVLETYSHSDRMVDVSHIMLPLGKTTHAQDSIVALLDSLRTAIINGKADFNLTALKYSIDPQVRRDRGNMGWIAANQYPYTFENVAYATPVGEISQVMQTPFGNHIIKVNGFKPNPGEVNASHILKVTRGLPQAQVDAKKAAIDSIYNLVKGGDPTLFAQVAKAESEDPGSAANGGQLQWFGPGMMVPEFEQAAFALADGAVSEPVQTAYGWHIILRHDHRDRPSLDEMAPMIKRVMGRDDRMHRASRSLIDKYMTDNKWQPNEKGINAVEKFMQQAGKPDSLALARVKEMTGKKNIVAYEGKKAIYAADIADQLPMNAQMPVSEWNEALRRAVDNYLFNDATEAYIASLPERYPEYRNLYNEYRNGILLFDVSNQEVWGKPQSDPEGLEKYFEANRANYTWDKPHYKGYIIYATNDSILNEARAIVGDGTQKADSIAQDLRNKFGRDIKIERIVSAQGDNPVVDNIAFGAPRPETLRDKWSVWMPLQGRVINAPEEARDVRGAVSTDWQEALEKEWLEQLRAKYPVIINREVLEMVK